MRSGKAPTQISTDAESPSLVNSKKTRPIIKSKGEGKLESKGKPSAIPAKTSSKRVAGDRSSDILAIKRMKWEDARDELNENLKFSRKRLKPQASFSSEYVDLT